MDTTGSGQLAAETLHEIRQPLLGLKAWLQMSRDDATRAVPIDLLLAQVERIEQILSDYQRLSSDRPAPREKLTLSAPVRAALASMAQASPVERAPEFELISDAEVQGNARLLEQLVVNLVTNAREAVGPEGRVKVVLTREGLKPALYVADWGPGIPAPMRKKIFEAYVTTRPTGAGLGLVICRRIVAEHHARLDLAPATVLAESVPPSTVFRVVFDPEAPAVHERKRVLVVDDEAIIRMMFHDLLGKDCEVVEAATAEDALVLLGKQTFALVLADKNLPGLSGLDLALAVRKSHPGMKFMLMTGYPSLVTAQQSAELGLVDYLTKPFDDIKVVREKVRRALATASPTPRRPTNKRVDVYDDNPHSGRQIAEALTLLGLQPNLLATPVSGGPDAPTGVVLSWDFTPALGVAGLKMVRRLAPGATFVVLAEHLTMDSAIESLRGGASACLPKLLTDVKALSRELQRALKLE